MATQTVYRVGNSVAVTIPKEYQKELGIKSGSKVSWKKTKQGLLLTSPKSETSLTPEFKEWLEGISQNEADLIKELAKK
ncbi:MAG: AbrB/MazE/SpoVT family DNA-binding domain-containing protein [Candidatus Blackburnbacteria bacterium]|nr:AbrB/MazE/SpoVT family DNA-binding domain-containing protein [Candidatus Blackburnbacteria bacterium]